MILITQYQRSLEKVTRDNPRGFIIFKKDLSGQYNKHTMKVFHLLALLLSLINPLLAQETIEFKVDALTKDSNKLAAKEKLELLSKVYMDYQLQTYPEFGTFIGKPVDNTRWTDLSMPAIEKRKKDRVKFLEGLRSINRSDLDAAGRLNYDLLKNTLELEKAGDKFPSELLPIEQMGGYHQQIMQVARVTTINNNKDVEDFFSRLQKIPTLVD